MPERIPLYACGWPAGIRMIDVARHLARMGLRVRCDGLRLIATPAH